MSKDIALEKFDEAQALYNNRDYVAALALLDELDAAYPENKNIVYARARCYASLGNTDMAVSLCQTCIDRWNSPHAIQLFESLQPNPVAKGSLPVDPHQDTRNEAAASFTPRRAKTNRKRHIVSAIILVLGTISIAAAQYVYQLSAVDNTDFSATNAQFQEQIDARAKNRALARQARIAQEDGPSLLPSQLISREIWERTAVNSIPQWKAGIYRNVPCPDSFFTLPDGEIAPRTIDVYVPMAYQQRTNDYFPLVVINWASMNPGFIGLKNWAEQNDVILLVVNSVGNRTYALNGQAQDAALLTLVDSMRVDTDLGFAIGMSGGAATSWEMICRYPENFSGLVMMGISQGHNDCWIPSHVRVAYIYGQTDHNIKAIQRRIPQLRNAGNRVRAQVVPGGHVTGPLRVREQMLTWMLNDVLQEQAEWNNNVSN